MSGSGGQKKKVRMLIMDVDGTLTDGKVYIGPSGEEFKAFNIQDGLGIKMLKKRGIIPALITGRNSKIVDTRAKELGIDEVYQGIEDKLEIYNLLKGKYGISDEEVAYVGDDLNDLPIMNRVGLSCCVANAVDTVKSQVDLVTKRSGGEGAVREVIEMILRVYDCAGHE
jgi:3-deoxy-D-manno-octulosonate 8-phosphate phosphatase (KDO 8-P phosphatase)